MRRYYEFAIAVILIGILSLMLLQALACTGHETVEAGVQAYAAAIRMGLIEVVEKSGRGVGRDSLLTSCDRSKGG